MRPRPALWFIFITLLLDIMGFGLVIPVAPRLVASFRDGNTAEAAHVVGWLGSIYGLMQFLCSPVLGNLSDRFGRRPVILISLAGSVVDFLIQAAAPSLGWFFVGRLLNGISGANITAANAYIADVTPPEKRAAGFGIVGAAFGLGFILGPLAGGFLAQQGLRAPFWAAAGLTVINLAFGLFVLPESLPPEHRRPLSWGRANPAGSLAALRRFPVVVGLAASFFLWSLANFSVHSVWVLYTGYRYHWSDSQVGVSLAIVGLATGVVQMAVVRLLTPRIGDRRALIFGMAIGVCNLMGYGLATRGWMIYAILAIGSLSAVSGPSLNSIISRNVPPDEQGAVQGAMAGLTSIATVVAPLLSTSLFGYFIGPTAPVPLPGAPFFFAALLMLTSLVMAARFLQTHRDEPTPSLSAPGAAG